MREEKPGVQDKRELSWKIQPEYWKYFSLRRESNPGPLALSHLNDLGKC